MLFGISGTELMVILVIALVLVGPDKLPDYARKVGRFIHSMRVRGQALSEQSNIDVHGLVQDSGINDIRKGLDDATQDVNRLLPPIRGRYQSHGNVDSRWISFTGTRSTPW